MQRAAFLVIWRCHFDRRLSFVAVSIFSRFEFGAVSISYSSWFRHRHSLSFIAVSMSSASRLSCCLDRRARFVDTCDLSTKQYHYVNTCRRVDPMSVSLLSPSLFCRRFIFVAICIRRCRGTVGVSRACHLNFAVLSNSFAFDLGVLDVLAVLNSSLRFFRHSRGLDLVVAPILSLSWLHRCLYFIVIDIF